MKHIKRAFLFLSLILVLAGCSGKAALPAFSELAAELHASGTFSTEITPVDNGVALQIYALNSADVEDGAFYFSSGASSDELALVKATSEEAAAEIARAFEARVRFQAESYADYMPEEVPKLENALVQRNGVYVLLCVAEDADGVRKVMEKYF